MEKKELSEYIEDLDEHFKTLEQILSKEKGRNITDTAIKEFGIILHTLTEATEQYGLENEALKPYEQKINELAEKYFPSYNLGLGLLK